MRILYSRPCKPGQCPILSAGPWWSVSSPLHGGWSWKVVGPTKTIPNTSWGRTRNLDRGVFIWASWNLPSEPCRWSCVPGCAGPAPENNMFNMFLTDQSTTMQQPCTRHGHVMGYFWAGLDWTLLGWTEQLKGRLMFNASENMWDSIRLVIPSGLLWWMDALPRMDVHFNECSQHVLYNIMMHCHTYSHTPENTDVHTTRPNIYIYILCQRSMPKLNPLFYTHKKRNVPH